MIGRIVNLQALSKKLDTVMIPAESSNIEAFGYDMEVNIIWVLFKNHSLYSYKGDVGVSLYGTFIEGIKAESKGKWVNKSLVNNNQLLVKAYEVK